MKVIIAGPPHSGKSVFIYGLCKLLRRGSYFLFRACPDGEGSWTYRAEANNGLRRKGKFDRSFMDYVLSGLKNVASSSVPLTLVDVGGERSAENEKIFAECDAFIVLSSSEDEMMKWRGFGQNAGLVCLALLRSDLHGEHTLESSDLPVRGTVAGLERGQLVISPCHEALAEILRESIVEKEEVRVSTITTAQLAERLGKVPVERTLPNGKTISQLVWEGSDLPQLQEMVFGPLAAQPPAEGRYVLDGPAPAWLTVAFAHGTHPQCTALNDPRLGAVDVLAPRPSGGEGKNLSFSIKETEGFTFVEFEIVGGVFDVTDLDSVRGPAVNPRKGVVLSGRGPNWLTATLALGYHLTRWVATWQPGFGATVAMVHHNERKLGEVIPDEAVRTAREA